MTSDFWTSRSFRKTRRYPSRRWSASGAATISTRRTARSGWMTPDLRIAPERDRVGRRGRREQEPLLLGLKVLECSTLSATVSAETVLIEASVPPPRARLGEGGEDFAGALGMRDSRCRAAVDTSSAKHEPAIGMATEVAAHCPTRVAPEDLRVSGASTVAESDAARD